MTLPVIILSLEDAVARRAPLVNAFGSRGVPFEIWKAVDGRHAWPAEFNHMIDREAAYRNLGREMGNAEFACALSHQLIYRAILDRGLDAAVILEDDAIVDDRFFAFLERPFPADCDLLLLDHMRALVRRYGRKKLGHNLEAHRCARAPLLTTGYLVTRKGAAKLIDQNTPLAGLADWPTDVSQMQTYAVYPRLVDHPDLDISASDIRQNRKDLIVPTVRRRRDPRRFLKLGYWRKTYNKRLGKWIS